MHSPIFCWSLLALLASTSYSCRNSSRPHTFGRTLRDYSRDAQQRGAREAVVPYAVDEEEGEMLGTVLLNVRLRQARFWLRTTLVCFMSAQSDSAGSVPQTDQWLATIVRAEHVCRTD